MKKNLQSDLSSSASPPTLRRERKKWEKESSFTPFADYKELEKWSKEDARILDIKIVDVVKHTQSPQQPHSSTQLVPSPTTMTPIRHLIAEIKEEEILKTPVRVPVQRASSSPKIVSKGSKIIQNNSNTPTPSKPTSKSYINMSKKGTSPSYTIPVKKKSMSSIALPHTPENEEEEDATTPHSSSNNSSAGISFLVGVVKILAHLASLRDGTEKQKEIKLASLEKRCRERLPLEMSQSTLDLMSDFRFLNALYETPDLILDIRTTNREFESKARLLVQNIPEKYLLHGLNDEKKSSTKELNAAVNKLIEANSRRVSVCGARIDLNQAVMTKDRAKLEKAIKIYKEAGGDPSIITTAYSVLFCLQQLDLAISSRNTEALQVTIEKAVALKLVDVQFAREKLALLQKEQILMNDIRKGRVERDPIVLAKALTAADAAGLPDDILAEPRTVLTVLEAKARTKKGIDSACALRDVAKISVLLDYAKSLPSPPDNNFCGIDVNLNEAIVTATSLVVKLQEETKIRNLLEVAIRSDDRAQMEEASIRAQALGLSQEVQRAQLALKALDKIRLKCHHAKDIRVLLVPRSLSFTEVKSKIEKKFSLSNTLLKYRDDVGDLITIVSQDDWEEALSYSNTHTTNIGNSKFDVFVEEKVVIEKMIEKTTTEKHNPSNAKLSPGAQTSQGTRMALAASVQQLYSLLAADRLIVRPATADAQDNVSTPVSASTGHITNHGNLSSSNNHSSSNHRSNSINHSNSSVNHSSNNSSRSNSNHGSHSPSRIAEVDSSVHQRPVVRERKAASVVKPDKTRSGKKSKARAGPLVITGRSYAL